MAFLFAPFLQGALAGILVTAPVGPICILCVQRSLARGKMSGIASGFGSATAIALYGTLGFAGAEFLPQGSGIMKHVLPVLGAGALCFIGIRIFRSTLRIASGKKETTGFWRNAGMTFLLELVNPVTIVFLAGLFVSMGRTSVTGIGYGAVGMGIFFSAMTWWLVLCPLVASFRRLFTPVRLLWLNRAAGIFIIFLGLRPLLLIFANAVR